MGARMRAHDWTATPLGAPPAMICERSRTIGRGAGASGSRTLSAIESVSTEMMGLG